MTAFSINKLKAAYASATNGADPSMHIAIDRYVLEVASMREWLIAFVSAHIFGVQEPFPEELLADLYFVVEEKSDGRIDKLIFAGVTFATIQTMHTGIIHFTVANEVKGVLK